MNKCIKKNKKQNHMECYSDMIIKAKKLKLTKGLSLQFCS